jgi:hypothetical protein
LLTRLAAAAGSGVDGDGLGEPADLFADALEGRGIEAGTDVPVAGDVVAVTVADPGCGSHLPVSDRSAPEQHSVGSGPVVIGDDCLGQVGGGSFGEQPICRRSCVAGHRRRA